MHDYYQTLGVNRDASTADIKKAYRTKAFSVHPDQGGDNDEMTLLNDAYITLADPRKRHDYDEEYQVCCEDNSLMPTAGALASHGIPYSAIFKKQHADLVANHQNNPVMIADLPIYLEEFQSTLYQVTSSNNNEHYNDIFSLVKYKTIAYSYASTSNLTWSKLTPATAVEILFEFLQGKYYGTGLTKLTAEFTKEIKRLSTATQWLNTINLYSGINEIFKLAESSVKIINDGKLLAALTKITAYAKQQPQENIDSFVKLFQSNYFRQLASQALHCYWLANDDSFDSKELKQFDGQLAAQEFIDKLKLQLKENHSEKSKKHTLEVIRYLRLLANFDKAIINDIDNKNSAVFYRKKAYLILNWIPALLGLSTRQIIANIYLQAGCYFQKAAICETDTSLCLADENLALKLYLSAFQIAQQATPDIELYVLTLIIKNIQQFKYEQSNLKDIIPALQKRCSIIADIFPFFQAKQSNIDFVLQENQSIYLMRQFLQALIKLVDEHKSNKTMVKLDHNKVTIFYQAYEACLKNWYQERYDAEAEKAFRYRLMQELLTVNHWKLIDLAYNLNAPWSLDTGSKGWTAPTRCLHFANSGTLSSFKAIDGLKVNYQTGDLTFQLQPWKLSDPDNQKLFTLLDLDELFARDITSAIFSLDPADTDMQYHPYNKMRFAPSALFHSQFLHTLLLTDYLLKFLTVGQEVQRQAPFDLRPIDKLTQHLPQYLKKILDDFHAANHTPALHRFWIEAEEVPVALSDGSLKNKDYQRYALGDMKMVVKKHVMIRNVNGELVDKETDDEGWEFYVITNSQLNEFLAKKPSITAPAMLFVEKNKKIYCLDEDYCITEVFMPKNCDHHLIRLFKLKRDLTGQVLKNSASLRLMYRITKLIAKQSEISHRFSAEYIFAQEFSSHYNEFAQYLPEFGRLRELSKATVLVKLLHTEREQNNHKIKQLKQRLQDKNFWSNLELQVKPDIKKVVGKNFANWREQFSTSKIRQQRQATFDSISEQIGTLTFTQDSPEVKRIYEQTYFNIESSITEQYGYAAWAQQSNTVWYDVIVPQISGLVEKFNTQKRDNCIEQLQQLFVAELAELADDDKNYLLDAFLYYDTTPLLDHLVKYDELQIQRQIQKIYPTQSLADIGTGLNGWDNVVTKIISHETNEQLKLHKASVQKEIDKLMLLENSFKKIGFATQTEEIDLSNTCLWVPASTKHDVLEAHSRLVYGGVHVNPTINILQNASLSGKLLTERVFSEVSLGQKVYRVWGDGSSAYGSSWTSINPGTVSNYRDQAGLPNQNTGRFISEGYLKNTEGVIQRSAYPLHGNAGGLNEVIIPNSKDQVHLVKVSGVNPSF